MKKILFILAIVLSLVQYSEAGTSPQSDQQTVPNIDKISEDSARVMILYYLNEIGYRINGLDRFKMYQTENIYNLLKLDTKTGKIWQVQWNLDREDEMTVTINSDDLSFDTGCGTFELYPTKNMYQFILLDQVTGRTWHVQWGTKSSERWIRQIF